MNTKLKNVIILRLDKIGDLVCTLPIDQVFSGEYNVHWVISQGLGFIPFYAEPARDFTEINKSLPAWDNFKKIYALVRKLQPEAVIQIQTPWWAMFAVLLARVKIRAGVLSSVPSFLCCNKGLRQRRSMAIKHEYEYNLELAQHTLKALTGLEKNLPQDNYLKLTAPEGSLFSFDYIVVHPGMAGSALNWPQENYLIWIEEFLKQNPDIKILITGTKSDEKYLNLLRDAFHTNPSVQFLVDQLDSKELLQVLAGAKLVIAPSTGIAHLAASLGRQVYAIFSPIRVQSPTRWAPRGDKVKIFLPPSSAISVRHDKAVSVNDYGMDKISIPTKI